MGHDNMPYSCQVRLFLPLIVINVDQYISVCCHPAALYRHNTSRFPVRLERREIKYHHYDIKHPCVIILIRSHLPDVCISSIALYIQP